MHWSRLVDAPIAALMLVATAILGSSTGETAVLLLWPFLLSAFCMYFLLRAAGRFGGEDTLLPAAVLGAAALHFVGLFQPATLDHHNVQLTLAFAMLALLLGPGRYGGLLAGVCAALMVAVGMETLPYVVAAGVVVSWLFLVDDEAETARGFGIGMALTGAVAFVVTVAPDETTEILLNKAETALYHAKRSGRGRVVVYTREMEEAAKRVTRIEQALRRAVSAGEVEPHFQPIVDLRNRKTIGFETLARWTDRDLGFVSPSVFIPIAEERGIIGPLSQLVLRKATEAARNWPSDLFLSFNLSPSQLVDQNTGLHILAILDRTGFDPRRLEIEITETGLMSDPASAEKIVEDLRRVGIRVSLDDFGTGQSSLGRLREFHFDKLKIDRAFVSSILDDRPSEHIIRAILAMCEGLGMDVVAEGIEEEEQADRLVQFGCGGGQGYLFGKPANADATLGYLRDSVRGMLTAKAG